jgi:hypothetical protein
MVALEHSSESEALPGETSRLTEGGNHESNDTNNRQFSEKGRRPHGCGMRLDAGSDHRGLHRGDQHGPVEPARGRTDRDRIRPALSERALAYASGYPTQTTAIVTATSQPVVSVSSLLELARWCQRRLAVTEDCESCPQPILARRPPVPATAHRCGEAAVAEPDAPIEATAGRPADTDAATTPPRRKRQRRKGGGQ